ncbi:aspartate--tRNA ligase [Intestinimonas sp. MSJ-38]|uniref:aspartate--tRNA ligase n=1 Tax=Intestinimonas sp. MSJ-38 TaxID=2841532 RepID=UPI001C102085|nr:aspartate--tRNA ligase [Intestinimonas sp. MSJ-38]MBU5431484.1 aspartate--tRNA ligase [Intestinimonas sp. MSJ-38]
MSIFLNPQRHYCGSLREEHIGQRVTVCGWCARMRDLGGLIFIDLRDREGIVQCIFDEADNKELFDLAFTVRSEYTLKIEGVVRQRSSINDKIPTGRIEILADSLEIYEKADTPPFEISDEATVNDALRLKYRYLDLRRPSLQKSLALRHKIAHVARQYFDEQGFLEIETPMLTKSTPEGARDYLVPSRVHPGEFYALPQSPQQYKQLLMLSGFDRYIQIVRCFRDEDLRADRQPEFTQIDLEMSFVDQEDVMAVNEGFLQRVFKEVLDVDITLPIQRMPYQEAMERFGSDKPDLRFGYEIFDLSETVKSCGFGVFDGALEQGGTVRGIKIEGGAKFSRKEIDSLTEFVKTYRVKGLAWAKVNENGELSSSFAKFLKPETMEALLEKAGAGKGDLVLIVADTDTATALNALGMLRCEVARRMDAIPEGVYKLLWVTDFPLFEYGEDDEGKKRLYAKHHPFTAPKDEDLPLFETNPIAMRAKAYDIVLNGTELGGGSIRIHRSDVQQRMFKALGFEEADIQERFGHMIEAFRYGAPPHGGLAYGLDRLVMLMAGRDSIRDVIAFPKVQNASDLMMHCPSLVDEKQLKELSIALDIPEKKE